MPTRERDSSVINTIFQIELETDLTLADVARFFKSRSDISPSDYFTLEELQDEVKESLIEDGWVNLNSTGANDLWDYLCKFPNNEIEDVMDGSGFTNVDDKSVEWLVETLMERDQDLIDKYLEVHGYALEKTNDR